MPEITDAGLGGPFQDVRLSRRAIVAASVGNGLEFYDFVAFAFFAIQIGETFFPHVDRFTSLTGSLATFAAGFIARPVGALVLGTFGDKVGRKPAMLLSFTLMGVGIAVMALTPSYAQIGVAAPIIVILARLMQGFALGGDIGAATTYMVEAAPVERRGRAVSWQGVSQSIGASLAALVGASLSLFMSDAELSAWGWRIALMLGALIVPFGLIVRNGLPETMEVQETEAPTERDWMRYRKPVALAFVLMACSAVSSYILNYMATYGQGELGLSAQVSLLAEFGSNFIGAGAIFLGGVMSDRHGRRPWIVWPLWAGALVMVPSFWWMTIARDATSFLLANLIIAVPLHLGAAALYCAIVENVPKAVRVRAFALTYSFSVAIFGGTTQLFVTWLLKITGAPMSIAWYCAAIQVVGALVAMAMPETAPTHRRRAHPTLT
jgi:MFS family permease